MMKRPQIDLVLICILSSLCGATTSVASAVADRAAEKPNIIFILLDDLGKEWISAYGAEDIETPTIDRLAEAGIRFENFYVMPQCTPTRVSLMTGQYPFRHGWVNHWDVPRWGGGAHFDSDRNPSVARMLQSAGYKTAVAGKWQVNDFRVQPEIMKAHGFDDYCMWTGYETGNPPSAERYWDPYLHTKDGSRTYAGQFAADIYTDFLIDFMRQNRDAPMYLYFAPSLPHTPFTTTPLEPDVEKAKPPRHKAMVRYMDHVLGRLLGALDELGLREETLVIFTTDNGSTNSITGTRHGRAVPGAKTKSNEAGTAVPFIVSQPGTVPEGVVSEALIDITDMLPTFLDLAGGLPDERYLYDGRSMADVFHGKSENGPREWILSMGGGNQAKLTPNGVENQWHFRDRVIRDQRYKLYISTERRPVELYDLQEDPWEERNLVADPAHAAVRERLFSYIADQPAQDGDPIYEPLGPQPWDVEVTAESQIWKSGSPVEHP
jgi:arylsulfatase A-like enzyme